jgi:mannose-1-phosphate guanylyltransferase
MTLPAVILVGGQGTRLRPLTDRTRKDMLPLVDRPLLAYTFEHLARHGVDRSIISCGYLPDQIEACFGARHADMSLEYTVEDEPLGTGGAIGFAGRELEGSFFALNGDSLREADLGEMVAFHRSTGAKATILLTPVADPSRYGLVRTAADGRVESFLEKPRPEEIDTDLINAGLYVLEPEVLDLVPPGRAVSIEREVFPTLASEGSVYGVALPGYWLDVGTPETYLQAHRDVLERIFETEIGDALGTDFMLVDETAEVHAEAKLVPPVYVGPGAVVERGARLGSLAVLGAGAKLEEGGVVENAVVGARTRVGAGASVLGSIVGDDAELGTGCELRNLSVVGPGARVGAGNVLDHGLRVGADQHIPDDALRFS